jgi:opacity protein-like surface antigen
MKKLMLMFAIVMMIGVAGNAQVFEKGSQAINLDIGFGNVYYFNAAYSGFLPSFSGSYEYGIVEIPMGAELTGVISAGGYLGMSISKYGKDYWANDDYYLTTNILFGARGNYHFIFHDKFDPYAGILLGVNIESEKWKGNSPDPNDNFAKTSPALGLYAGARWFFTDNFAVNAELGYLISVLNVGVTFKF